MHYVAKFASAAQTNLGSQDAAIEIRAPVLSGRSVSIWKEDDRRAALLSVRESMHVVPMGGVASIIESLRKHKQLMLKKITISMKLDYGTTAWFKVTEASNKDCTIAGTPSISIVLRPFRIRCRQFSSDNLMDLFNWITSLIWTLYLKTKQEAVTCAFHMS